MKNVMKILLLMCAFILIMSCNYLLKEKSDLPPHVIKFLDKDNAVRIDKYNNTLIVYYPIGYDDETKLKDVYSIALYESKTKWKFKYIEYSFLSTFKHKYTDTIFINNMIQLNSEILNKKVLFDRKYNEGFVLKIE